MLQIFLAAILVVGLFTGEGLSQQCYSQPACAAGSEIETSTDEPTRQDCCVGTNEGQSYSDSTDNCIVQQCIVHGFVNASYDVEEGERLDTMFALNVKGVTTQTPLVFGTITSERGTARSTDFENLQPINVEGSADIRLFTTNDEVTLEYDDTIILRFTPASPLLIPGVESVGQFIRDTATVNIIDNDRLEINIEEADYSIQEDAASNPAIRLQFRRTQSSFTMTLFPVSFVDLNQRFSNFDAEIFINIPTNPDALATSGEDFTATPFIITIPATEDRDPGAISEDIQQDASVPRFRIIDDDVNEIEQSFALVAQLGDVPDNFVCFQRQVGDTECFGRTGATEIKIVDNDAMIIGFFQRRRTVSESDAPEGMDRFLLSVAVGSLRMSELEYEVLFRVLETGSATVEASNKQFTLRFDALFGTRENEEDPIVDSRQLNVGDIIIQDTLSTAILNDFVSEELECFDIRILSPDVVEGRQIFTCNEDDDVPPPTNFSCIHTICIEDDDEPFEVAYTQTVHTVIESVGQVQVCVNLTEPQIDILEETVRVESINNDSSVYIPADAVLATPDSPNFLGMYPMAPGTDYEEQIRGINRIRDIVINATRRIICYNLPIYDDMRLEVMEYAGLTLAVRDSSVRTIVRSMYDQVAIQILDDDEAVVGLERTFYQVSEDVGVVEVCAIVYSPTDECPIEFPFNVTLNTTDGSAVSSMDYVSVYTILEFDTCDTRQCTEISIVDDMIAELTESFFITLERTPGLDSRITLDPVDGEIEIIGDGEPGILVNDTLTGDPLMTVPIHTDPNVMEGDVITSLCYEVHGEAGKFFNLVSDSCVSVNSHYARALTNPNIDLNIVDAIGVRAVSNNGTCLNIRVGLDCAVSVNDAAISRIHRFNGITIRVYPNRVRISVPNCGDTDLVMWVFCTSGRTEDPTDWMYFDFDFIRFVVMRGLNLDEESHGLIGQFWNVPVDVTENIGSFNGAFRDDDYIITVNYPGSPPRSFVGLGYSVTWEFEKRPCLYVGNSQAGPLGETVDPNDSVIEGTYQNYEVEGLFSPDFDFSHFDETQCA